MRIVLLMALTLAATPTLGAERCRVTDPTGTPLNVHDIHMNILGTIENGRIVFVQRHGQDAQGKPWAFVEKPDGEPIGWVYREFISCF